MASSTIRPDYASSNMRLVGHSDQDGRSDGVQIMVHRGYAYIGHIFSKGFSVIDVRDPTNPKYVKHVAAPPNTWTLHLQAHGDLLLVIHNKDMFAQAELADERPITKARSIITPSPKPLRATGRPAWRSTTSQSPRIPNRSVSWP